MTVRHDTLAWAIDLRLEGVPGFLGVLGFEAHPQAWRDGLRIPLWRTRNEARFTLKVKRQISGDYAREHYWNRARVVRVRVTIRG